MMNDDYDDLTLHDSTKPAQATGLVRRGVAKFVWIQFGGWAVTRSRLSEAKPQTAAEQAKLDSDKFGDEAGDQTGGLSESCTRLKFSIT